MNLYTDIFKKHDVNVRKIIIADTKAFKDLPYSLTHNALTIEEQIKIINEWKYENSYYVTEILRNITSSSIDPNIVPKEVFLLSLFNSLSWNNYVTEIIQFISNHNEKKSIMISILKKYYEQENLVNNILNNIVTSYNLILNNFDIDILSELLELRFGMFDDEDFVYLTESHENAKIYKALFVKESYAAIKHVNDKILNSEDIKSYWAYNFPNKMLSLLSCEELTSLFYDKRPEVIEYYETLIQNILREENNFEKEDILKICKELNLRIPSSFTDDSRGKKVYTDNLGFEPNLDNIYQNSENELVKIMKSDYKERAIESALKLENILSDYSNIYTLPRLIGGGELKDNDQFILSLFNDHYDYIHGAIWGNSNKSQVFMNNLFSRYMTITDDKELAFKRYVELCSFNDSFGLFQQIALHSVRCPEYLDLLMCHDKILGLKVVKIMLENNLDNIREII